MQMANAIEERRQSDTMETSHETTGNGQAEHQNSQRMSTPIEATQSAGAQPQTQGNATQSSSRHSTSGAPLIPMTFRIAAKEPPGTHRTATATTSSAQRKRSRLGEEGGQGATHSLTKVQEHINNMNGHIETLQKIGPRGNTGTARVQMTEIMKEIMSETINLMAKLVNMQDLQINYLRAEKQMKDRILSLQEENINAKQQIVDLQLKVLQKEQETKAEITTTYAQMASKNIANNIIAGKQMPLPQISQQIKHAPSECIIIFKAEEKGEMKTKKEQENFRKGVRETLNEEEQQAISAIRPTRYGGHTIIFQSESTRNQAYARLRNKEQESGIEEEDSKMVAPMKRVAKVVCKEVPDDISIEQIKRDMFGKHNPALQMVNNADRTGKIYKTRLGMIFELTGQEMAAIQSQGWKIRCDLGREMRVEEFISLQQCYACAKFGHSAVECKADEEVCRLCGKSGHAGKDCEERDNKEAWRCANCHRMNQAKNLNLDVKHAAAQLHKCPVAQQQKNMRKLQLASTGIFTTPIQSDGRLIERPNNAEVKQVGNGAQDRDTHKDSRRTNRSRSMMRGKFKPTHKVQNGGLKQFMRTEQGKNETEINPCVQRITKAPRPPQPDEWQVVGRKKQRESEKGERGRRSMKQAGTNSHGQTDEEEEYQMQTPNEELLMDYAE